MFLTSIWKGLKKRVWAVLYNTDRDAASAIYGTTQDTISSMVGRRENTDPVADLVADTLNKIQPGHTDAAIKNADALNAADDGSKK